MKIKSVKESDFPILIKIWESSVRTSHDFLEEKYILTLKKLIFEQYFKMLDLYSAENKYGEIMGFCGVYAKKIEMLFVSPKFIGTGVGSSLVKNAVQNQSITKVDVNEQNRQALQFYKHVGFKVVARSELDGQGMPYPILHMELK